MSKLLLTSGMYTVSDIVVGWVWLAGLLNMAL